MKKINLIILSTVLVFGIVFSGCKKDEDDPAPVVCPTCTTVISQETEIYTYGGNSTTAIKKYKYNADKKLIKIEYFYNGSSSADGFDTIRYSANGEIDSVNTYYGGISTQTLDYTYVSGRISTVIEKGNNGAAFERTRTFTYNSSGVIAAQTVVYTVGSGSGGPDNVSSIVFTSGNPTSADLIGFGGPATIVYEPTLANPYLGLNNVPDILRMFAANNATSAYSNLAPGSPFFTNLYTPDANGRVGIISRDLGGSDSQVTYITYACI